jgi:hypothetical protein
VVVPVIMSVAVCLYMMRRAVLVTMIVTGVNVVIVAVIIMIVMVIVRVVR